MAAYNSYLAFLEFRLGIPIRFCRLLSISFLFLFLGCDRASISSTELEASQEMAEEIASLDWSKIEDSFDEILSGAHIKTSNTSWHDNQGKAVASHTASYQINPKASGHNYLLLHSDSSSVEEGFDWPKQRGALRWLDSNPYAEIRLDSSVYKSARVIEKYVFSAGSSADRSLRSHKLEGRADQDIVFDEIVIKSKTESKVIDSIDYLRVQDGFLFKEMSLVSIRLDNDQESAIPVSFSVDSRVDPILLDPIHVKTEVSYKVLSDPDN